MEHSLNRLTVLAATLVSAQFSNADTLILNPTDNSTIRLNVSNQGTSQILFAGDVADNVADTELMRSAVAFDLSAPELVGATINSATVTFTLRSADSSSEDATITLNLHQLSSSFANGDGTTGVTWTSRDGTNDWITPGGDFGGVLASASGNPNTASTGDSLDFSGASLASAVEGAIGGDINLLLKSATEDIGARNLFQFASTRNAFSSPGPVLTIDYTPIVPTPPVIVPPTNPADDAIDVPVGTSLVATFSEPIALENGGIITIDDLGAGPDTVITLPDTRVSVSGADLVITTASPLANGTDYAVLISDDAVKEVGASPSFFAGISDPSIWNFQTVAMDLTAPIIVTLSPLDGGLIASIDSLVATFDEGVMTTLSEQLLTEDFETSNGGFTVETTEGTDWSHGRPDSLSAGVTIDSGNGAPSGEGQSWGTNLGDFAGTVTGDEGYYEVPTVTCLRSAPIDLTGVTSAQLTFAQAFDLYDPNDVAVVNIIDDTTGAVIAGPIYTVPNGSSDWISSPVIDLNAGIGQVVRIEWCLTGTGGATSDYLGWYIDDVTVTGSSAGGITLKNLTKATETLYPIDSPAVTVNGETLTIAPGDALEEGDSYAVQIASDALTDLSGNPFAGILDDSTWNFSVARTVISAFDAKSDTSLTGLLDKTVTNDLAVGLVSNGRSFRTYLTFDLSGASTATGDTTLVLSPAGTENNTSSVAQTFTLFVLDSDWDGIAQPGPEGTAIATIDFSPRNGGNDGRGISFTSADLTTAFNNALGGNLYLGIKSDLEGADARSFLWLAGTEEPDFTNYEPRLNYQMAGSGDTFASWIEGKAGVDGQTALDDDPDGDGNDNGVENFFGTEPGEFSEGLVTGTVNTGAGTFTFTHPQGALASDLTASYFWSNDLVTFHADGASSGGTTVNFSTVPDPLEAGSLTTVTATVSGTPVQKLFVRVEVTQN